MKLNIFLFFFALTVIGISTIYVIMTQNSNELVTENYENSPTTVGELTNFERVFKSGEGIEWRLLSDRALLYSENMYEFNNFMINLSLKTNRYTLSGDWGIVSFDRNSLNDLKTDGTVTLVVENENITLKAESCVLVQKRFLDCKDVNIKTVTSETTSALATFDLQESSVSLKGSIKTIAEAKL